jgi:predicted RNA methylase
MATTIPRTSYRVLRPKKFGWRSDQFDLYMKILTYLDDIEAFQLPQSHLEQYTLPSDLIAFILVVIANDLVKQNVIDLGCGTGRFTLPIIKFFSNRVLGIDIDISALEYLVKIRQKNNLFIDLLCTSIEFSENNKWGEKFQITFMNPPFGTKRRNIDMVFLKKALEYSKTVITIHKSNPTTQRLIKRLGARYDKTFTILATIVFSLPPSIWFHRKKEHLVTIDLIRLT